MSKKILSGLMGLAFLATLGLADDLAPVTVSPASETGPAVVRLGCPTFSWTAVTWALTYKVVVFETAGEETPPYETMAVNASPVLVKEIPGQALSWTPSAEEALLNGGRYVWYVGAMVNPAQGSWSEGRRFVVEETPLWSLIPEPDRKKSEEGGFQKAAGGAPFDLAEKARQGFNLKDDLSEQDLVGLEGSEGATNTFYGSAAGNTTMTGTKNSLFGAYAGRDITTGYNNTFLGYCAGRYTTTALQNTFVGYFAGVKTTTGTSNTYVGSEAGRNSIDAYSNVFLGMQAGYSNTSGTANVFVGNEAGYKNLDANYNTFVGWYAGYGTTTGDENTFIGDDAGYYNQTGNGNVFLGNEAGMNETGSNKLYIGNQSDYTLIYGEFDNRIMNIIGKVRIDTETTLVAPTSLLHVGHNGAYCNGGAWVDGSSRDFKENIAALTTDEATRAFEKLEPVKFNYKEDKGETYLGFIAEDVPELVAMNDRKGLNPMDIVAMLTKIVQEQQKEISALKEKIGKLENKIR